MNAHMILKFSVPGTQNLFDLQITLISFSGPTRSEPLYPKKLEEEEKRLYHKGQQSSNNQHDQPISHKLTKVASGWLTTN
jgi:hypothetical protein